MSREAYEAKKRGDTANKKGDFALAHVFYDEAISLSPQEMFFYSNKSAVFFEEGRFDDCIATCLTALKVGSENKNLVAKVISRIAKAKSAQGKISEALSWLEKASVEHPSLEINKMIAFLRRSALKRPATSKRPLSSAYASELISLVMENPNDYEAGQRTRNLILSSPTLTTGFVKFMQRLTVFVRFPDFIDIYKSLMVTEGREPPIYTKKWSAFSWIAPFIVELFIVDDDPDSWSNCWAFEFLPRTSSVLNSFVLNVPENHTGSLHPNVLPFIRRQLPNLKLLYGPVDFYLEVPPNAAELKAFKYATFVVHEMADLVKLFATKRFTSPKFEFEFHQPPNRSVNYVSELTTFFNNLTYQMPETHEVKIVMPVLSARLPVCDMANALYNVFPRLRMLILLFNHPWTEKIFSFDQERLEDDYDFLAREVKRIRPILGVYFSFEEPVAWESSLNAIFELVNDPPDGFIHRELLQPDPFNSELRGYVNRNAKKILCHRNKTFRYEVPFLA